MAGAGAASKNKNKDKDKSGRERRCAHAAAAKEHSAAAVLATGSIGASNGGRVVRRVVPHGAEVQHIEVRGRGRGFVEHPEAGREQRGERDVGGGDAVEVRAEERRPAE